MAGLVRNVVENSRTKSKAKIATSFEAGKVARSVLRFPYKHSQANIEIFQEHKPTVLAPGMGDWYGI